MTHKEVDCVTCLFCYETLCLAVTQVVLFRCSACERLFNTEMELEHHKEEHGHWSDDDDDDEEEESEEEMDDFNGNPQVNLVYEEETIFGPEVEERILLCSQD